MMSSELKVLSKKKIHLILQEKESVYVFMFQNKTRGQQLGALVLKLALKYGQGLPSPLLLTWRQRRVLAMAIG